MIYSNNYGFAGRTAILYNFELDYSPLGFMLSSNYAGTNVEYNENINLTEVGIEYKRTADSSWTSIKLSDETLDNAVYNGRITYYAFPKTTYKTANYLYVAKIASELKYILIPIRVVIRNLSPNTSYTVRSYCIIDGTKSYFNSWTATTLPNVGLTYTCTGIQGGTEAKKEMLYDVLTNACSIYNCMTSFLGTDTNPDSGATSISTNFEATIEDLDGAAAISTMSFDTSYITVNNYNNGQLLSTAVHELAHNFIYSNLSTDVNYYNGVDRNLQNRQNFNADVVKFMEVATHSEGAMWGWIGMHNYPAVSSEKYDELENYLVAAACHVMRTAGQPNYYNTN